MENSIGCSAGWRGRETPEGSEGEKRCCTGSLAVPGPRGPHPWAPGTKTPRKNEDPALEELVGQPPTEASLGGASLPGTSSVLGAAAAGTFMPREQGREALGLAPGL